MPTRARSAEGDPVKREGMERALQYMGLNRERRSKQIAIDKVFIGSCTNSRIEDLRAAAPWPKGAMAANVKLALVVGSGLVKARPRPKGLDKVFVAAGFEWREPGCSMCLAMNADRLEPRRALRLDLEPQFRRPPGPRADRQVSPAMAAAADRRPFRRRPRTSLTDAARSLPLA